jgi:RNA polymerase sigma factor (sigma-70 family)
MSRNNLIAVVHHVRQLVDPAEPSDAELLQRFVSSRDEMAFETLVRRHGPLVHGLCCQMLNDPHTAEDVFQAAFLVLASKAGSIRTPASLGSWLHGVACRLALNARRKFQRQTEHEISATDLPEKQTMSPEPADALGAVELRTALDEELARLPEKYRAALVLCGCAGKKTAEAARDLGLPEPTLKHRLKRGRSLLRSQLVRRGFTLSTATVAGLLDTAPASAAVPAALLEATARAAVPFLTGNALPASAGAVVLAQRLLHAVSLRQIALGVLAAMSLALFGGTTALLAWQAAGNDPVKSPPPVQGSPDVLKTVDRHSDPLPPGALARLGTIRWRHGGTGSFAVFLANGKQLLSSGIDGSARLWDATTGRELRRFKLTRNRSLYPLSVAVSGDGRTLVSAENDEPMRVWDITTGKETHPLEKRFPATAALALDRKGKTLAVWSLNGTLDLWDLGSGKQLRQLRGQDVNVEGYFPSEVTLAFSPDGKELAGARVEDQKDETAASVVHVWDIATSKVRLTIRGEKESNGAFAPTWSPDGKVLAWKSVDGGVRLVDAATGKELRKLRADAGRFAFSPDGKTLVTRGDISRKVVAWDVPTGKEVRSFEPPPDAPSIEAWGFAGSVRSIAVDPEGKLLAIAGEGCAVQLLDLKTGKAVNGADGHRAAVSSLVYLPGGKEIASRGNDGLVQIWNAATGKKIGQVDLPRGAVTGVLSAEGQWLATGGYDNVIRVWKAKGRKERWVFPTSSSGLAMFDFSPDSKTLAMTDASDWTLRLYDLASGETTLTLSLRKGKELTPDGLSWAGSSPAFLSPDGRFVAAAVPELAVVVWDARTGHEVLRVPATEDIWPNIRTACFSADSHTLAVGRDNGSVHLWEFATGRERSRLGEVALKQVNDNPKPAPAVHARAIYPAPFQSGAGMLVYAPQGRFLARNTGRSVSLWDVVSRKEIASFKGHIGDIASLSFAPDGKMLGTGGTDGTGLIWDVAAKVQPALQAVQPIRAEELATAWQALVGEDAVRAFDGITKLVLSHRQSVPFLSERLKPAIAPHEKDLPRWIADLDSGEFKVRNQASAALRGVGPTAVPALRKVLTSKPSLEVRQRVQAILADIEQNRLMGENLRVVRAIEALELIGSAEARKVLTTLAGGAVGAPATEAARAALGRHPW